MPVPAGTLDDAGLTGWLRDLGGVPDELLADPALLGLILPTVRADLTTVTTGRRRSSGCRCRWTWW